MLLEMSATTSPTAWGSTQRHFFEVDRSNINAESPRLLENGRESVAFSLDATFLQWQTLRILYDLLLRELPSVVELDSYRSTFLVTQDWNREQERIEAKLLAAFESEPLEDGMDHPAEKIIGEVLQSADGTLALEWLKTLATNPARPGFSALVLRCLGRHEGLGSAKWRTHIVQAALAIDNIEVRDAAAQAAESWGGPEMREVLKAHTEPESWLSDYIQEVVDDLVE